MAEDRTKHQRHGFWRHVARSVGPGIISGAADDDPSGIATYSIAGAQLGTSLLWTALITWPLMAAVQMTCARIGMVTGRGLSSALGKKYPAWLVAAASLALLIANVINIGADLSAMADASQMLTGLNSHIFVVILGVAILAATIWLRYSQIAQTLKWLAVFLFAYVATAILVHPSWRTVLRDTLIPHLPHGRDGWSMIVAIFGTTISPYLFFWQASQEVEEEKASGRRSVRQRQGATFDEILTRKIDVGIGTFFSNAVMFFIILTTASTLHVHGILKVDSSQQAADALRPIAGNMCSLLYTVGLLGVGLLAIPTLTGSAAYAFAETFGWRQGLDLKLHKARAFYAVVALAMAAAMLLDFAKVNPILALYWTSVINGVLAPFLLFGILTVACDSKIMLGQPTSRLGRSAVAVTTLSMFAAVVAMFVV